jgi:hypothetical protein
MPTVERIECPLTLAVTTRAQQGKFIAIVGEEVVGVFDSELTAYQQMKEKYGTGE